MKFMIFIFQGERPYSCETCTKSFSRKEHLMRHMLSHTGQRLYGCDLCHKHFSRKDNLHKHRTTHGVTGPLVCEVCGWYYILDILNNLPEFHVKVKMVIVLGKSFIVKHYYDMHMATHNEVEDIQLPYECDICKKRFATSQFLVTHRFRHRTKGFTNEELQNKVIIPSIKINLLLYFIKLFNLSSIFRVLYLTSINK